MTIRTALYALPVALVLVASPVAAVDAYTIELGSGDNSTDLVRVHAKWNWDKKWFEAGNWHLTGYWEATLGRWSGGGSGAKDLWDVGITPVFRLQPNGSKTGLYLEGGIGAHLLSGTRINDSRAFGSSFQFGDHVGLGATFGDRGQYDLGYRFQHLSNASIKQPNDGINFHQVRFTYSY
ncbi:MAG: acyloxyacyl hydrolase [Pseudomonadota bacterium]